MEKLQILETVVAEATTAGIVPAGWELWEVVDLPSPSLSEATSLARFILQEAGGEIAPNDLGAVVWSPLGTIVTFTLP